MKISLDWLGDYIEWKLTDPAEIAARITVATAEVDEVEQQGALLEGCCVGQISSLAKHPDADKLSVCTVKTDKGDKPIVCGGTNLREGMRVAFAHTGTTVRSHDGSLFTLGKIKIRGEVSEGMICAAEELELESSHPPLPEHGERPVIDLGDGDEGVGEPLRDFLGFTDTVLHIDNHAITHRPDLFSHIGFARECVAMGIATWKKEPYFSAPDFGSEELPFKMNIEDVALMPRYCSCLIRIDALGETPDWMKRRLEATGWRSINLPIDITNYVMMETGVPLHSFDADDIEGDVTMRRAKKGEKIVTLDGTERELSEGALILSDDKGVFDLLGIMGGLRSSTKESSKNLYLHSASLDPVSIRKAMIEMGHRTDAGTTYEKGVPPVTAEHGFFRAAQLMVDLMPGAVIASKQDFLGDNGTAPEITLSLADVCKRLGTEIPQEKAVQILTNLGFAAEVSGEGVLKVTPPLWRLKDVEGAHDLTEEIGRMYGYDAIEPCLPSASIVPPSRENRVNILRDSLKESGFIETLPLSLVGPELLERTGFDSADSIRLSNPIGEELSVMQPSVLPRLMEQAENQIRHVDGILRTFTVADVFAKDGTGTAQLGLLLAKRTVDFIKEEPFLLLKQDLLGALVAAGFEVNICSSKTNAAFVHPGRAADIAVGESLIGTICELHPSVIAECDLPEHTSVAFMNVKDLLAQPSAVTLAQKAHQFPAIRYDITVERSHNESVESLINSLQGSSELLEHIDIVDLYRAKPTDPIFSLTLRFTYRSAERTLTDEEAKAEHDKVIAKL